MEYNSNFLAETIQKLLCSLTDEVVKGLHECMYCEIILAEIE